MPSAHELSNNSGPQIGHSVIVANVATVAAIVVLVLFADLTSTIALAAFFVMFVLVLGADLYVKHKHAEDGEADATGATDAAASD